MIFQIVYLRLYYSPETVYCLTLSHMARMEMGYNLKKVANFFKFSLLTDQIFGPESTLDTRFFHKMFHRFS